MQTILKDKIDALITYANETTGKADTRLDDAVKSLADGYGGGGGGRLPKDYDEVEWIETSGAEYIDTGILAQSGISAELKFMFTQQNTTDFCVLGSRYPSKLVVLGGFSNKAYMGYSGNDYYFNGGQSFATNIDYTVRFTSDNNGFSASLNDSVIEGSVNPFVNQSNLCIFARGQNSYADWLAKARLYYCRIGLNGSVLADLIPCIHKPDNAIGLYDLIRGQFFANQGKGWFGIGANVN